MWKKYIYFLSIILLVNKLKSINAEQESDDSKEKLSAFFYENKAPEATSGTEWSLGVVHYYLDHKSYDEIVAKRVRMAMNILEDASCVRFKALLEPSHDAPWILIHNQEKQRECQHTMSNNTGFEMNLVLGFECLQRWQILHALMHAIGFKDEVTHPQRDQFVRIIWDNIQPKYQSLFSVHNDDFPAAYTEYDPMSIMHFHDRAFSRNGQATIAPLMPGLLIDPSGDLSPLDKMRLRITFGHECNKRKVGDLLNSCKSVMHDTKDDKGPATKVQEENQEDQSHDSTSNEKGGVSLIKKEDDDVADEQQKTNDEDKEEEAESKTEATNNDIAEPIGRAAESDYARHRRHRKYIQ